MKQRSVKGGSNQTTVIYRTSWLANSLIGGDGVPLLLLP